MSKPTLMEILAAGQSLTLQDGSEVTPSDVDVDVTVNTDDGAGETGGEDTGADENIESNFGITDGEEGGEDAGESDEVSEEDLETELVEVESAQEAVDEHEEAIDSADEEVVALQHFYDNLQFTTATSGALGLAHAELATQHFAAIGKRLGLSDGVFSVEGLSVQSFQNKSDAIMATQDMKAKVKSGFVTALDWILKAVASSVKFIADLITRVFNNVDKLLLKVKELREQAAKVKNVKTKNPTFKSAGAALKLKINGKTASPVEASKVVADVLAEANSKWAPAKMGMAGSKLADELATKATTEAGFKANRTGFNQDFSGGWLSDYLPFTSKTLTAAEAKDLGIKLADGEKVYVSERLPGEKAIVTILPTANKEGELSGRTSVKLASIKADKTEETRSIDIPMLNDSEIGQVLGNVETALRAIKSLKGKIDATAQLKKKISGAITKARANYLNISKMKDAGGIGANMKAQHGEIKMLKAMILVIDQPGASLSGYTLVECHGLLNIVSQTIKARTSTQEKKDKK